MDPVKCFWMEPTAQVQVSLRRYRGTYLDADCASSGYGYHNAQQVLTRGPAAIFPDYHGDWVNHADPGWPTHCVCGYQFAEADQWQCNPDQLYQRQDTGELYTQNDAPAGAMLHMAWNMGISYYQVGADGLLLGVKLPNGNWWCVDGPAVRDGQIISGKWQRQGEVPIVTANPSIDAPGYHGWLRDGWLHRC